MHVERARVPGLDMVRSLAILLVLWDHGVRFLPPHIFGEISPHPIIDGVDLFFVLSGWLVTGALYEKMLSDKITVRQTLSFYMSRWLRTLPAYWVVLCINILLLYLHFTPGLLNYNAIFYFVFLQNFHQPLDLFFWESWSLSVEEWFYLGFPILLLTGTIIWKRPAVIFLTACLTCIVGCFFVRLCLYVDHPLLSADLYFRKLVVCRLDMIAWGGLSYYAFKKSFFRFKFAAVSVTFFFVLWIFIETVPGDFFEKVIKFSCTGLVISLLMPYMYRLKILSLRFRKVSEGVSRMSYSLYLVHLGIVAGVMKTLWPTQTGWLLWTMYISASFVCAGVLYVAVEKPFLRLRAKWS